MNNIMNYHARLKYTQFLFYLIAHNPVMHPPPFLYIDVTNCDSRIVHGTSYYLPDSRKKTGSPFHRWMDDADYASPPLLVNLKDMFN